MRRQTTNDRDVLQPSEDLSDRALLQDSFLALVDDFVFRELGPYVHFVVAFGVRDPISFYFAGDRTRFHEDLNTEVTKPELIVFWIERELAEAGCGAPYLSPGSILSVSESPRAGKPVATKSSRFVTRHIVRGMFLLTYMAALKAED